MAYPDNPEFIDFVDERTEPAEVEAEEHSISAGQYTYSLSEVPDTEFSISCTGDVNGPYTVSFTNAAPGSGCVYVNPLNGNVLHCATDAPDDLTWSYWGRGTANNKCMLEQYREPIEAVHRVARQLWVSATSPASQGVNIAKGNAEIAGKLVEYNGGTQDFSSITFDNPGYYKAIRVALTSAGSVTHSEGEEASSRALCDDPPAIPESKTLAIVFLQDGASITEANIVNTLIEVSYHSGDPDSGGSGDVAKYQYASGVVSGDAVCLSSPNTVNKADADEDDRVPSIGFVEEILDETYCTVRSSGLFDFSSKSTSYDSLIFGQQVYLSTAAGRMTQTRNQTPDEWDQPLGIALSAARIQISIGAATKNKQGGVDPDDPTPVDPDKGAKFKRGAAVSERDFVYMDADLETVKLAKADADETMPAIGIIDSEVDATWCIVKNNYIWVVADHNDLYPGGLTPGAAGDIWYISVVTAGDVDAPPLAANPEHYVQIAVRQIDAGGTKFLICCGPAAKPQPSDPDDGYDCACANDVSIGDSVYIDSLGVARRTVATDDAKVNAIGIVSAVNQANNRCTIVRPPNVYRPAQGYAAGEWVLNPDGTPGAWLHIEGVAVWPVGSWKVRIGWGRGVVYPLTGLLVDIKNYGKMAGPGDDDGTDADPHPDRVTGRYTAPGAGTVNSWAEFSTQPELWGVTGSDWESPSSVAGVILASEHDVIGDKWYWTLLEKGLHGADYTPGAQYYAIASGQIAAKVGLGKYKKLAGIGQEDGRLLVCPGPVEYCDPDGGDPVPIIPFVEVMFPVPTANYYDKMRDHDGSTSAITEDYVSDEWLVELPTIIASVDFFAKSTGAGAGAFLELDLCSSLTGTLLSTKAKLVTTGVGVRGDTLPSSANSAGHVRAVIDNTMLPIDPGETLYWKYTRNGAYTTAPYGIGIQINKYGVKA